MAAPLLPEGYTLTVTDDALELRRADGAVLGTFALDAPALDIERLAWGEHRRDLFKEAGYDADALDIFEVAGNLVLRGEDDEEVAERLGLNANDLYEWVQMEV